MGVGPARGPTNRMEGGCELDGLTGVQLRSLKEATLVAEI